MPAGVGDRRAQALSAKEVFLAWTLLCFKNELLRCKQRGIECHFVLDGAYHALDTGRNDGSRGKPVGINEYIGRRPIAAFGNPDGDPQMLEWTQAAVARG